MLKANNIRDNYEKVRKEAVDSFSLLLKNDSLTIFNKYPKLENFSWTQYSLYWNDGEPTYFNARIDSECIDLEDVDYEDPTTDEEMDNAREEFSSLLYSIGEDMLEDMFGDHVRVTISRAGVSTSKYTDHD